MNSQPAADRPPLWKLICAYLILYIVWGSTFLAIRFTVETIPPLMSGGIRFFAAGAILLAARAFHNRGTGLKVSAHSWALALRASLLPFVISYGIITAAEQYVPSYAAGLIIALEPLWFCLLGWLFFGGKRPTARNYAGIALGFAGMCVLMGGDWREVSLTSGYTMWMFLLLLSTLAWVGGAFISADPRISSDTLTSSGLQMFCGGVVLIALQYIYSAFTGEWPHFGAFSMKSALAVAYLVIFGSLAAYSAFLWLMRVEPASRVSTHGFVNPVIAVILGVVLGGEELHTGTLIALPLVVASVALMISSSSSQ